jgi:type IV pilus biogenesis protein CpaD/CtpE
MNGTLVMNRNLPVALSLVLMTAVFAGCSNAPRTPVYDSKFGESVRQARAIQTLNPEAGKNNDPVTGLDGESARHAIDRYQESFRTPAASFEVLGIGGNSGNTGQGNR